MKWLTLAIFVFILTGHFLYVTRDRVTSPSNGAWATFEYDEPAKPRLERYVQTGDFWLGLSYGLAGAFASWCFARIVQMRRAALAGSAAGLTLSAFLGAGVCFFTGCCGSPMLPLYLGLFGPKFLSVTKPLTFGLTLVSIIVGYAWMLKRSPKAIANNVDPSLHETFGANAGQV